jgi:hypothetical protein
MLTLEERTLLTDVQDRLLTLYVQRGEAEAVEDWVRMQALQAEIETVEAEREALRRWDTVGAA